MKKLLFIFIAIFGLISSSSAEATRITSGKENAKITIIAYESLTCSHCADFHAEVYPLLKKVLILQLPFLERNPHPLRPMQCYIYNSFIVFKFIIN